MTLYTQVNLDTALCCLTHNSVMRPKWLTLHTVSVTVPETRSRKVTDDWALG